MSPESPSASPALLRWSRRGFLRNRGRGLVMVPALLLIGLQMRGILSRPADTVIGTLDGGDAVLQSGILTWTARHLHDPAACSALPIFHPSRTALMSMDSLVGQALSVLPLYWLFEPSPALLYNLATLVTLLLCAAAGAFLWLSSVDDPDDDRNWLGAGFCALFLVGSPFTVWQLGMLNQISPPWVVMFLAAAWRGWRHFIHGRSARRWWWIAAMCLGFQAAWGWYGFADAFFVLMVGLVAGIGIAGRRGRLWPFLGDIMLPVAGASVVVMALALPYLQLRTETSEYTRHLESVAYYSAQLSMLGDLGPHRWTLGDLDGMDEPAAERALRNTGGVLHPGWLTGLFALIGLARWRVLPPSWRRFGGLVAVVGTVGLVMSLGDSGGLPPGSERRITFPFGVLRDLVVPFQAFRAPVRFVFLAVIAVSWWATAGVLSIAWSAMAERSAWRRRLILVIACLLILAESVPVALLAVPIPVDGRRGFGALPDSTPAGAVLTVPAPATEADETVLEAFWLHRALATGHPVTGGQSGWVPLATRELRRRLARCEVAEADVVALLDSVTAAGVIGVEVAEFDHPDRVAFWTDTLDSLGWRGQPTAPGYRFYSPAE